MPPAPGLFSTMTGWPRCFAVASASARMVMSVVPPATMERSASTGFVGNCCADAVAASATASAPVIRRRNNCSSSLVVGRSGRGELSSDLGQDPRGFAALHAPMSSWYLSSAPSVSLTVSGSSASASSATSALVQSMVSATPGSLNRSILRSRCTKATISRDERVPPRPAPCGAGSRVRARRPDSRPSDTGSGA